MFPDSTLKWRPFPSIIDGIKPPPFALSKGMWRGAFNLIVVECVATKVGRAFFPMDR
jgi:hypothetical protein